MQAGTQRGSSIRVPSLMPLAFGRHIGELVGLLERALHSLCTGRIGNLSKARGDGFGCALVFRKSTLFLRAVPERSWSSAELVAISSQRAPDSEVPHVEAGASSGGGSAWTALRKRSDGRRMGAGPPADPSSQARRASSDGERSRGSECDLLCALDRLSVEGAAQGLPPRSTVWEYLDLWDWDGTLGRIHHALYVEVREKAGREASPTTAIIDSQTAKGAVKGGLRSTRPAMTLARRCLAASATS